MSENVSKTRPKDGCARCYWWQKHQRDNFGKCMLQRGVTSFWAAPPCPEYERDGSVPDTIELTTDAEI